MTVLLAPATPHACAATRVREPYSCVAVRVFRRVQDHGPVGPWVGACLLCDWVFEAGDVSAETVAVAARSHVEARHG